MRERERESIKTDAREKRERERELAKEKKENVSQQVFWLGPFYFLKHVSRTS